MSHFLNLVMCSLHRASCKEIVRVVGSNCLVGARTSRTSRVAVRSSLFGTNAANPSLLRKKGQRRSYAVQLGPPKPTKEPNLWKSIAVFFVFGGLFTGILMYLKHEKTLTLEKERKRSLGKVAIGGKFELVDQDNKIRKSDDFLGTWLLIYFGFTHCPDICPDEMEKLAKVVEKIDSSKDLPRVTPIFITVDPERDTTSVIGKYIKEFSDRIIGLTGTVEQIASVCKAYRVYFSPGPKDKDSDYIVDHSIIMYLIDPQGNFIDYYGQNKNADQIVDSYKFNVFKYEQVHDGGFISKLFS